VPRIWITVTVSFGLAALFAMLAWRPPRIWGTALATVGSALVLLTSAWQASLSEPTPRQPAAFTGALGVRVWKKGNLIRGLALNEPGALPLRAGDWMRIEAKVTQPAYLYVIYLDAAGKASPLFPWRDYDWQNRPPEEPLTSLHLPENPLKDAAPLDPGPSGVEAVLLLVRSRPLSEEDNAALARLFRDAPPQGRFDPLRGAAWLSDVEVDRFGDERDRGRPGFDQAGQVEDPVQRVRRLLRGELRAFSQTSRAVCFPFRGE
jgi:hypothetical protein